MTYEAKKSYPNGKLLLTQAEVSAMLGTSPQTLQSWPIMRCVLPDGRLRYARDDVEAFVASLGRDGELEANQTGWEDVET